MVQVEMSNTYIDMSVNNGSEKWTGKNTAAPEGFYKRWASGNYSSDLISVSYVQ